MTPMLPPPDSALKVSVVVPAHNEEELVGSCLTALAEQSGISPEEYEVLLVLDRCTDGTEERALEVAAEYPDLRLRLIDGPGRGAGYARRAGMDEACARLLSLDRPDGLIASTDADTVVASDWLPVQLQAAARGARAIGGRIELRGGSDLPRGVSGWRDEQGRLKKRELQSAPDNEATQTEHWQFSGASLALTAAAYKEIGGLKPRAALEDEYLERTLTMHGIPIERPLSVRVTTSARTVGRARRGLARDLALASWIQRNTYGGVRSFDPKDLIEKKRSLGASVSVVVPTKGQRKDALLDALEPLADAGLVDETILLIPDEEDGRFVGRESLKVYRYSDLMTGYGPVRGLGDAMWRGLEIAGGELVVFLDAGTGGSADLSLLGLLGPLLGRDELRLVKGSRTCLQGIEPDDADEVTELVVRPLLGLHAPELLGFAEPLSGELAARRDLLETLPFPVGEGVRISLLLDAAREAGTNALAESYLGPRLLRSHRRLLSEGSEVSYAVLTAVEARTRGPEAFEQLSPGPLVIPGPGYPRMRPLALEERPPLRSLQRTKEKPTAFGGSKLH